MTNINPNEAKVQAALCKDFEILRVMKDLNLRTIARKSNVTKAKGTDSFSILTSLVFLLFLGRSIHNFVKHSRESLFLVGGKDVFYRLCNKKEINWRNFLYHLSLKVLDKLKNFSTWGNRILVIDDTIIPRRGKKIENLSWLYDHVSGKSVKGFSAVVLGWNDGSSFIPLDFSLSGGSKKIFKNDLCKSPDKRRVFWKRRQEIDKSKIDLAKEMLHRAKNKGIDAGFVLFDSWYCFPSVISEIFNDIGYNVISMLKTTPKLGVTIGRKVYSTKRLWDVIVPSLSKRTISVGEEKIEISSVICTYGGVETKLVFCVPAKKSKSKKPVILLSTDTTMGSEEIINKYQQRWSIEVLFKEAKSKLFFGKYHCRNFESNICFLTLSLIRFVILSYMERIKGDFRYRDSLFEDLRYEIESLNILAFVVKFLSYFKDYIGDAESIFALFWERLEKMQETIKSSIEKLIFLKCET